MSSTRPPYPKKNSTQKDRSDAAAVKLGLPATGAIESIANAKIADAYGLVCQTIKTKLHNFDSPYLAKKISASLAILRQEMGPSALDHDIANPQEANAWRECLLQWPIAVQAKKQEKANSERAFASAPAILQFWAELTRIQDLTAFANTDSKATKTIEFAQLAQLHTLPGITNWEESLLLICRANKEDEKNKWTPIVGVWLHTSQNGKLEPVFSAPLVINHGVFFDSATNEPKGAIDASRLEQWLAMSPKPATKQAFVSPVSYQSQNIQGTNTSTKIGSEPWPAFYQLWDDLTEYWLECVGGLIGLNIKLYGANEAQFTIQLINTKEVKTSEHSAKLAEAAQKIEQFSLLKNVLEEISEQKTPDHIDLACLDCRLFLGHMDTCKNGKRSPAFPLDPTQRLAAMEVANLPYYKSSKLLPINGPPGTGKTSFLRAALASLWVNAALDKEPHPKIVYGTAATNQAVSNMIEAFGTIRSTVPDGIAYPWIEKLNSYGWFYPSQKAAENRPDLMHLVWNSGHKTAFMPSGAAKEFAKTPIEERRDILLSRAIKVLDVPAGNITIDHITEATYKRLDQERKRLHQQQDEYEKALELAANAWMGARGRNSTLRLSTLRHTELQKERQSLKNKENPCRQAYNTIDLLIKQQQKFQSSWRAFLPTAIRNWIFKRDLTHLSTLQRYASDDLKVINIQLPEDLLSRETIRTELYLHIDRLTLRQQELDKEIDIKLNEIKGATKALQERKRRMQSLYALAGSSPSTEKQLATGLAQGAATKLRVTRLLARWASADAKTDGDAKTECYAQLLHYFEAPLDTQRRVKLFHWAARYWECRWVQEELKKQPSNDAERLERLMMLGVIIVATTHKVLKLGEVKTADLLIMDEAGQCLPEIAAACLTLAKNAAFVGDVKQLQPVANISPSIQDSLERKYANGATLPDDVKSLQGSGMKLAQAATRVSSGYQPGITLLFHYRCVPSIIGYCNELLYEGKIINARKEPRMPHLDWLPSMSWVGVNGTPQRNNTSWINTSECRAIVRWLLENKEKITLEILKNGEQKKRALSEMVAIVTPLAAQANEVRQALIEALGEGEVKEMVIGTVHKLQGAERPIVLFSLVQNFSTNSTLMADRDGGMLMNVAVSRARDAFVIFADQKTLKPAWIDGLNEREIDTVDRKPVSLSGHYLRRHGQRLYPNVLVIVEAPGKVKKIEEVLGTNVVVLATSGNLRKSSIGADGFAWTPSPDRWLESLKQQAGLVREIVIATDDDLAGELIGMHAAEDVTTVFNQCLSKDQKITIRRMRFTDMTESGLRTAFEAAGTDFDENRLAAALVREFANAMDATIYQETKLPMSTYASAQVRDALAWIDETHGKLSENGSQTCEIWCSLRTEDGNTLQGFVVPDQGALAKPLVIDTKIAQQYIEDMRKTTTLSNPEFKTVMQIPALYPANTSPRVLSMVVDELGLDIEIAQAHLNALYLQGSEPGIGDLP
jgi:hypothetical protein